MTASKVVPSNFPFTNFSPVRLKRNKKLEQKMFWTTLNMETKSPNLLNVRMPKQAINFFVFVGCFLSFPPFSFSSVCLTFSNCDGICCLCLFVYLSFYIGLLSPNSRVLVIINVNFEWCLEIANGLKWKKRKIVKFEFFRREVAIFLMLVLLVR